VCSTRDQAYFEASLSKLATPVKVVWGADDFYIRKEMGVEFADKARADFTLLPGAGHYVHLQVPNRTVGEIRAAAR
jgi:pimeloyl-ACP methyl ester carboxylesterase